MAAVIRNVEKVIEDVGAAGHQAEADEGKENLHEVIGLKLTDEQAGNNKDEDVLGPLVQPHGFPERAETAAAGHFLVDENRIALLGLYAEGFFRRAERIAFGRLLPDSEIVIAVASIRVAAELLFQEFGLAGRGEIAARFRALITREKAEMVGNAADKFMVAARNEPHIAARFGMITDEGEDLIFIGQVFGVEMMAELLNQPPFGSRLVFQEFEQGQRQEERRPARAEDEKLMGRIRPDQRSVEVDNQCSGSSGFRHLLSLLPPSSEPLS